MGRGSQSAAKTHGISLRENKSDNLFSEIDNPLELIQALPDAQEKVESDFITRAKEMLSPEWQAKITSDNLETVETVLYASFYYNRYKIDPYRLQDHYRKSVNNISGVNRNRKRSFEIALQTLIDEELPPYTEKLEKELEAAGLSADEYSAKDLSQQALQLIWASKNNYSPKIIRKNFSAEKLNNKAIEAIVKAFADYRYEEPEVFPH